MLDWNAVRAQVCAWIVRKMEFSASRAVDGASPGHLKSY